ncbi:NADPH-dependent FMN reductase [Sulfitobacter donghicola]|uniref:NADPH-dependent FMN reductase n=1 Tax=Sulfitobacter donghicola DSW-25 = KCTC 12864 = JCM 14565 TaxID=1300350 RepID=A0A073IM96_9RHOB|nr:NAD(P)H-dependent oxidoreductase [Sulfitobacter donghicola]KEJ90874.1 NADPH-dependent FMN reductase [Sulfitobacter donghicola DSW-25 = KCTC 12864 = JCM 14565]KIN68154.1 NADPH-dependent fmn reductase domain protein [Sulfitobacter donghicola DSW-25 = KCTC 12864 = JCM 14565]
MATPKLLGISGSLRKGSHNAQLLAEAARLFGDSHYTQADLNLPLYDGDDEEANGVPAAVETLAQQIADADAVVISTPEYNKGPSGVLKNALDWVSRSAIKPWGDKPVAVMSAAAGRAGGERAQSVLRGFMVPFRPRILQGPEIHLASCYAEFDDNGHLKSEIYTKDLTELMAALRAEIGA